MPRKYLTPAHAALEAAVKAATCHMRVCEGIFDQASKQLSAARTASPEARRFFTESKDRALNQWDHAIYMEKKLRNLQSDVTSNRLGFYLDLNMPREAQVQSPGTTNAQPTALAEKNREQAA